MQGEVRIVPDVPAAFAALAATEFTSVMGDARNSAFRIAASAGASGKACFSALAEQPDVDFSRIAIYFVDERCVDPTSPDSNQKVIGDALASHRAELDGFYPMSCANGPGAYEAKVRTAGRFDLVQLGLGPDGHTASIFPGSPAMQIGDGRLVATNHDTFGDNQFDRLTLTYAGIALGSVVVFTVIGAARAGVLARIASGEELPASLVHAERLIWLIDEAAGSLLSPSNQ